MGRAIQNILGPITHILAGLVVFTWAVVLGQADASLGLIIVVVAASLLPDIDSAASLTGRLFGPISEWIEYRWGHRTITHTLWFAALVALFCWSWFGAPDWWIILAAWLSHLIVDMIIGRRGVPLLWPFEWHFYIVSIKPGGSGEIIVAGCIALAVLFPLYIPQSAHATANIWREVATPQNPTPTTRPTNTPTPTATPQPMVIRIGHVYDKSEILVQQGSFIRPGDLIADLTTYRTYHALPSATPTPQPTSPSPATPPAVNPVTDLKLQQAQLDLALAEAKYNQVMHRPAEIDDKYLAQIELHQAQLAATAAALALTPTPTNTPTATHIPAPRLDESRIYSKINGIVYTVRIAAINGNEMTIEIEVYSPEIAAALSLKQNPPPTPVETQKRSTLEKPVPTARRNLPPATPTPTATATATPEAEAAGRGDFSLVVITSTPTAENIATAATISAQLTAQATRHGTPTLLPLNWVTPVIVTSTPPPENQATTEYLAAVALTTGTPQPLPPNVWTATVTPVLLAEPLATSTSTPTPTATPNQLPIELLGKILFLSDRAGAEYAYALDPETGQVAQLSDMWPYEAARARDHWSVDGNFEAYTQSLLWAEDPDAPPQLHLYDHLYQAEILLTTMGAGAAWDPAWSPDGQRIAFVSNDSGDDEIWVIKRDGSGAVQLTESNTEYNAREIGKDSFVPEINGGPSWSQDGRQIIFHSNRSGNNQLWLMEADGSSQRPLLAWEPVSDWAPVWVKVVQPPPQRARTQPAMQKSN